ncbi:MAG TPA: HAD family hydrolase [Chthoniobacteraceae bacterium]|nr:HAD family hydrolase [Chthoniobacteraceae bacterium]
MSAKAVLFDVDGTLVDSVDYHAEAWQHTLEHFGYPQPFEAVRAQIGKGGDQLLPVFLPKDEIEKHGKEIEKYRRTLFQQYFFHRVRPFPGVRPLFERLMGDGWVPALASSAKEDELHRYKEICRISDLLKTETTSEDVEQSKPHPDIFRAAMKRLGNVRPRDCVVIGDSPYDAQAARKAKIRAVGFLCGGFEEEKLRAAGCEEIYKHPADLLEQYEASLFSQLKPGQTAGSMRHS